MPKPSTHQPLPDDTEQHLAELEQTFARFVTAIRTGAIAVDPDTLKRLRRLFEHY